MVMKIDTHQHYWRLERGDYDWLTPSSGVLYQDYLPHDLSCSLRQFGIDCTILVQAAPTIDETEYLLSLADEDSSIAGVVGWMDLRLPSFKDDLVRLLQHPKFVGIRPTHGYDKSIVDAPMVRENLNLLIATNVPIDVLSPWERLIDVQYLLSVVPKLRAVINHLGSPEMYAETFDNWREFMEELAYFPRVMVKLSGFINLLGHNEIETCVIVLRRYVEHLIKTFGVERIMFGSDWPVCLLTGSYNDIHQISTAVLENLELNSNQISSIMGQNAARFYQLARNTFR